MKWSNASADNPGYSVYHYTVPDTDILYVIRQKRKTVDFNPVGWRVFVRNNPNEALRTIYTCDKLAEAKQFVKDWEDVRQSNGGPA